MGRTLSWLSITPFGSPVVPDCKQKTIKWKNNDNYTIGDVRTEEWYCSPAHMTPAIVSKRLNH